jgi:formylglycine-generating enzyme required for sulfatase activity
VTAAAKLLEVIDSDTAPLTARIRAREALASLGDPRAAAVDRAEIPAGALAPSKGHLDDELTAAPFTIDRPPVTVAAYAECINSGGYDDLVYWTRPGWACRTAERALAPRVRGEAESAASLAPNHPEIGVRAPSEVEWQWTCRGPRGACSPWGKASQEDACGQRCGGPRDTVSTGVLPSGASPFGICDRLGSVWRWCSDIAPQGDREDEPQQIARGGAWNNLAWSIGCTRRNACPLSARFSNLGFRCVL